jgi:hypothetical protein
LSRDDHSAATQQTLTGEEADERQRPETMLWCDNCMKYILRSNRYEHPHDLTNDVSTDDGDGEDDEPERVGAMYRVEISYNVDYTFRIPAWSEHEAEHHAEILQTDAQPSSMFQVHTETSELTTLMTDHEKVPDGYDPEGGTPLYEVYGDDG